MIDYQQFQEIFSRRICDFLREQNKTQQWLAETADISPISMSQYISKKRTPHATNIVKIAKAMNVSCDYLIGLSDCPHGNKLPDIVKVVRCKDCIKSRPYHDFNGEERMTCEIMGGGLKTDDFCSYGRKV